MPEEYDYRATYLKSGYRHCYMNVTRAGWAGPPPFPRLAGRAAGPEATDQAIVRDIFK